MNGGGFQLNEEARAQGTHNTDCFDSVNPYISLVAIKKNKIKSLVYRTETFLLIKALITTVHIRVKIIVKSVGKIHSVVFQIGFSSSSIRFFFF